MGQSLPFVFNYQLKMAAPAGRAIRSYPCRNSLFVILSEAKDLSTGGWTCSFYHTAPGCFASLSMTTDIEKQSVNP